MKFEEMLPAFREGKRIRRECWKKNMHIDYHDDEPFIFTNSQSGNTTVGKVREFLANFQGDKNEI